MGTITKDCWQSKLGWILLSWYQRGTTDVGSVTPELNLSDTLVYLIVHGLYQFVDGRSNSIFCGKTARFVCSDWNDICRWRRTKHKSKDAELDVLDAGPSSMGMAMMRFLPLVHPSLILILIPLYLYLYPYTYTYTLILILIPFSDCSCEDVSILLWWDGSSWSATIQIFPFLNPLIYHMIELLVAMLTNIDAYTDTDDDAAAAVPLFQSVGCYQILANNYRNTPVSTSQCTVLDT